ncbi:hypothetical protein C8R44DRAFT_652290, partial [Mycena epipterygia]
LIIDGWTAYYIELKAELGHALGKISFMMDVWSSKALEPYLAVTAHWLGL